ncbi:MAG: J domain-containing protein [Gammaproteobacteria bacterium]|uniref:J domain-containing protein n=1 Tax=Rhodoferax sp. TaxID=50421 RepID=UPI0018183941|nr:J domain-containing protein [Rhodoferax sp.]MBU3898365.1 J domain-containing protein [Gammaproteobacteria bacterium]MBA3059371.1 J domain-containing protein [Rhodoferax sp.]MBU3998084.1 J domain-containing protein [Gammaproteobacteria bacterium]MBU4019606.1 J domain-containing protein [Gammaproteobacteria bacterium]MBU4079139.1 J domain-containing protein [Gammaproteobacteria bacterium]
MQREVTLYEILEVSPHASAQVIRAAYRCLAQCNHPDKNAGSNGASERQAQINSAYGVLSDPRKRRRYDQCLDVQACGVERRGSDLATRVRPAAMDDAPPVSRAFVFRPFK